MVYVRPAPNTDPNNFGTVDQTLDPSMSDSTIQNKIDLAGVGGVIEWAGSTHYTINTNLRFLSGQKHFTDNGRIIKCTNTATLDSIINLKAPKGGGPASTNVTISDLEFWGHTNVPSRPPDTAPRRIIIPWRDTFLRRVTCKGASFNGLSVTGDRIEDLNIVLDTCEVAYNVHLATGAGEGGFKFHELGICGTPLGSTMTVQNCHVHHNWGVGMWWDIGCGGVNILANESDNNARTGLHWEISQGPVYIRDNYIHHNGGGGDLPYEGGTKRGLTVQSGWDGKIINNTFLGNDDYGIYFVQDTTPITRSSLSCPDLAHAGYGYWFHQWDVLGNVLNGNGVNNEVLTNPAINYSTTPVVDGLAEATETDAVIAPIKKLKTRTVAQVVESDQTLGMTRGVAPLVVSVNRASETDIPQVVVRNPKGTAVTQVEESDSVLAVAALQSTLVPVHQVLEEDEGPQLANPGTLPVRTYSFRVIHRPTAPFNITLGSKNK